MSSNINDYVRPTDNTSRRDINKILSLIHDFVAQEPEETGLQERIMFTPHVKLRTSTIITGAATWAESEVRTKEAFVWRKVIPDTVNTYDLTHVTTGTLTFPVSDTKFGGRCDFDGTAFITISDDTILDTTAALSISGFFYIPATDAGDVAEQTLVDKGVYGLYMDPYATAANQIRGKVKVVGTLGDPLLDETGAALLDEAGNAFTDESAVDKEVVGTITPNAWNHISLTYDGTNLKLYIDTVLTDTTASSGTISINALDLTIG